MKIRLIYLMLLTCDVIYGIGGFYEIKYNAAVEIQEVIKNNIEDYEFQYSLDEKDPVGWHSFEYNNSEEWEGIKYLASGINIGSNVSMKPIALRLRNIKKVSDVHYLNIHSGRTTFLKISLENGNDFSSTVYSRHMKTLPYKEIFFHVKDDAQITNLLRLIYPLTSSVIEPNTTACFSWQLISCSVTNAALYLIIGKENDTVLSKTNVTGLSEYNVNISEEIYQLGKYWWMISAENNNEEIFHSESRFFYVSDIIDADGDEYNDMEELASGSDPNDPSDIPLIIISNPVCTNAYYGQQYYNPLKVNDNRKRVFWISQGMLPSGIILSREGVLFGIPKGTGSFLFDIEAFNEAGKRDVKRFYMTIKTPVQSCIQSGAGGYIDEEEE